MKLRALLIDDEPLARERLRFMLNRETEIEVIGEHPEGASALKEIPIVKPDVIFLDIHMPGMDGFELLEALAPEHIPWTIFLTAHDKYAVRAFEARALDYLLKPVSQARLHSAIEKVRERIQAAEPVPALKEWLAERENARRLVVRNGSRVTFVTLASVVWIESAGNYAIIHTDDENHILRETINELDKRLPGDKFLRISRAVIVNRHHVVEMTYHDGHYEVKLSNDHQTRVTRSHDEIEKCQS